MGQCFHVIVLTHSYTVSCCVDLHAFLSVDRCQTWDPGAGGSNPSSSSCLLPPPSLELWPWWLALHLRSPLQPPQNYLFFKEKEKKKGGGGGGGGGEGKTLRPCVKKVCSF